MKLSGVDANLLVALDALLRERNVTRAAARIGVGQSAMSHSLARLREHFGDALLVPRGRELVLTERARRLVDAVAVATAAVTDVFIDRPGFDPGAPRTFVLACTDLFSLRFVPEIHQALSRDAPGVELEVRALASRSIDAILGDGVELAFGVFEDVPATVNQLHLFHDPFVCVVRADHPRADRALSLEAYLALPHLEVLPAPNARPGDRVDRLLAARGARRRVTTRVPYFLLAAHVLTRSDHVLTMTHACAEALTRVAPLRIVKPPLEIPPLAFSQIWHRRHDDDAAPRWLRDAAARICRDHPAPL
jgi:DNA-binding transcriptional LysR family regulator